MKIRFAIHAGAGLIQVTPANEKHLQQHLQQLKQIVAENYAALQKGAAALDAVQQAVMMLEDYEGFNAGRGSVLNAEGVAEMDAGIMDGSNARAGAVAAVKTIKNPIVGARVVMEKSEHVLMVAEGAEQFCKTHHVAMENSDYFITEMRKKQLQQMQSQQAVADLDSLGTVGAVARDAEGNLAAATSTGGKANKLPGRVGDSPIIGAGVWADNETCAVSGTGDGEIFIRTVFAHTIHSLMLYKKMDLQTACQQALKNVAALNGGGGCIAIAKNGDVVLSFNTSGMFRGWVDNNGEVQTAII